MPEETVDNKIPINDFHKSIRPMELDLLAVFKIIESEIRELVKIAIKEKWDMDQLEAEINLLFEHGGDLNAESEED